jgi:hypothetical protein
MGTRSGQRITVRRGESVTLLFVVKDPAGAPINLDGYAVKFAIGTSRSAAQNLELLTESDGELSLLDVDGTKDGLQIALGASKTAHPARVDWWDLRLTSGSTVKVVAEGPFVILDSLTD